MRLSEGRSKAPAQMTVKPKEGLIAEVGFGWRV